MVMEPYLGKAARKLGIDQVAIHRVNAPESKASVGPPNAQGRRPYVTSAFVKEALDKGAELFKWEEKKARSGKRQGSKVRGIGVATSPYIAGSVGFDGLFLIKPDGRVTFQSGIGNLGTHSVIDVHRVAAEMLDVPWEKCEVALGNTAKHLPWT
jgi:CO/xanthine dehydrogenase Mo-binding subunit